MLLGFIASLFLARLLTPHEIGIFSVAYVFAGLLRTIREMGLGAYIVQEAELTDDRLRTASGIAILIAVITGGIVASLAVVAGDFYREAGVTQAIYVIAFSFLLVPFGATTMSVLRRGMRFRDIAIIDLTSVLAQNGSAITLAWLGFSYMSLAWSSLIGIFATVVAAYFFRPKAMPWKPSLREWRRVLSFSSFASGSSLVNYASYSANDLVLGRMLNMESVALVNRANGLSELVTTVVGRAANAVSLPYFSKQQREGTAQGPAFIQASTIITMILFPTCAVMATVAEPLILLLFGPQWTQSIKVLQILCLAAIVRGPALLSGQVMAAAGGVRKQFALDVQGLVIKFTLVIACAGFGLQAVAWGIVASNALVALLRLRALNQVVATTWRSLWPVVGQGLTVAACSMVGPVVTMTVASSGQYPPYLLLVAAGLSAAAGWLGAVFLTTNPLRVEIAKVLQRRSRGDEAP